MRLPPWAWWMILAVLAVLTIAAWAGYDNYCHCHCYAQKEYSERWGWPCQLVGDPNNFLTLFGLVGVGLGFLFVSGQMAQTDKAISLASDANEHTKRSVDAYVDAERGRIVVSQLKWYPGWGGYTAVVRNIGRTLAIVRGFRIYFDDAQSPYIPGGFEHFVDPLGSFIVGLDEDTDVLHHMYPIPENVMLDLKKRDAEISATICVLYEVIGGQFYETSQEATVTIKGGIVSVKLFVPDEVRLSTPLAWQFLYNSEYEDWMHRVSAWLPDLPEEGGA